jgi:hypothetical protein
VVEDIFNIENIDTILQKIRRTNFFYVKFVTPNHTRVKKFFYTPPISRESLIQIIEENYKYIKDKTTIIYIITPPTNLSIEETPNQLTQ